MIAVVVAAADPKTVLISQDAWPLVVLGLYFLPTLLGLRKRNRIAIFALNFLLGWTFLGWVAALVWALRRDG